MNFVEEVSGFNLIPLSIKSDDLIQPIYRIKVELMALSGGGLVQRPLASPIALPVGGANQTIEIT